MFVFFSLNDPRVLIGDSIRHLCLKFFVVRCKGEMLGSRRYMKRREGGVCDFLLAPCCFRVGVSCYGPADPLWWGCQAVILSLRLTVLLFVLPKFICVRGCNR